MNLIPTKDRPLSSDFDSLRKKYEERMPLYIKYADKIIDGNNEYEQKIVEIVDDYFN